MGREGKGHGSILVFPMRFFSSDDDKCFLFSICHLSKRERSMRMIMGLYVA